MDTGPSTGGVLSRYVDAAAVSRIVSCGIAQVCVLLVRPEKWHRAQKRRVSTRTMPQVHTCIMVYSVLFYLPYIAVYACSRRPRGRAAYNAM